MTPDETEAIFAVCFFLVFGVASGVLFWHVTLNRLKKKWLLDEYEARGMDATATLVHQYVRYNTEGGPVDRYHVIFRYPCPFQNLEPTSSTPSYQKEYVQNVGLCQSEPRLSASFPVKVLPDYPKSGIPKAFVDSRGYDYNEVMAIAFGMPIMFLLYITALPLFAILEFTEIHHFFIMSLGVSISYLVAGYPLARKCFDCWKREILEKESTYRRIEYVSPYSYRGQHRGRDATTAEPARENYNAIHAYSYVEGVSAPPEAPGYGSIVADQHQTNGKDSIATMIDI